MAEVTYHNYVAREETEIIEGEVVELQIDRPVTGAVSSASIVMVTVVMVITRVTRWES